MKNELVGELSNESDDVAAQQLQVVGKLVASHEFGQRFGLAIGEVLQKECLEVLRFFVNIYLNELLLFLNR